MMIKQTSRDGGGALFQRLESGMEQFTQSERTIANFLLGNRQLIAFESAASLAEKLQISPATVGRFCRRIGYRHFKALKADLKINAAGVPRSDEHTSELQSLMRISYAVLCLKK